MTDEELIDKFTESTMFAGDARLDDINRLIALARKGAAVQLDLALHLERQRVFSERTFGPGMRTGGVIDHIRKELAEIEANPTDVSEWVDVILLALDGAWRHGHTPDGICAAIEAKQTKNENRTWPDWRTMSADKAIEHDRSALEQTP